MQQKKRRQTSQGQTPGRAVPALWLSRLRGGTPLPLCGWIFSQVQFTAIYCNLPRSPPRPVLSVLSEHILEINDLRGFVNLACALSSASFPLNTQPHAFPALDPPFSPFSRP